MLRAVRRVTTWGSVCRRGRGCWKEGERTRKGGVGVATPGESQSPADLNAPRNLARRPRNLALLLYLALNRKRGLSRHRKRGIVAVSTEKSSIESYRFSCERKKERDRVVRGKRGNPECSKENDRFILF